MWNKKNFIKRQYRLENIIKPGKVLIVYGPRRSGKTTLLNDFLSRTRLKYKIDSGDNVITREVLGSGDFSKILGYAEGYQLIAIDEAQQVPNIGLGLKILVDQRPDLTVIATGSSSFDLSQQVGEPLTGRKKTIILFPFSQSELLDKYNKFELKSNLSNFLIFGSYPEVATLSKRQQKIETLEELASSYLLKDVFSLERIKAPTQLIQLLKLLAFQLGNEVSLSELAAQISLDVKTVGRYLDILEKAFVVKRLGGFGRNLRKEISSKGKYYFYDNGMRNAVISQFNSLDQRNDQGALFENFVLMERFKNMAYRQKINFSYFWRTYAGQEIDLIEERDGQLFAFEIKWSSGRKKIPTAWKENYPDASYQVINRDNYLDFIGV